MAKGDLIGKTIKSCGCLRNELVTARIDKLQKSVKDNYVEGTNIKNLSKTMLINNTSGYKGVSWDKSRGKWNAQIVFQGKHFNLGRFDKIEDAIKVRKKAEEFYFRPILDRYQEDN